MYELLPRYDMIADGDTYRRPYELHVAGVNPEMARRAYRLHLDMDAGWAAIDEEKRPTIVSLYTYGHATLGRAEVVGGRLRVTKGDPEWHAANNPRPDGDGTVPGLSAVPWHLDDARHVDFHQLDPTVSRHMPLATTDAIVHALGRYWNVPHAPVRGPGQATEQAVWLGLDMEEQYAAGQPIQVGARLWGITPDENTSFRVTIRTVTDTGRPGKVVRSTGLSGGDGWRHTVLDPLPVGRYLVAVSAANVPGRDNLVCEDHVAVLPDEAVAS